MEATASTVPAALRDVTKVTVVRDGGVETVDTMIGVRLLDRHGAEVIAVSEYLASLLACGANVSSLRSYGKALLRWWRFLAAVGVEWDRASRVEVRDFVLWMRSTSKRPPGGGLATAPYAPATIDHNLAVLAGFYADRMAAGAGPVTNPVPAAVGGDGGRVHAHHNPMQPYARHRRAPLRQKLPARRPRGLPDRLFDELFAAVGCDRDRALLAFYVSTGARASELLGVTVDRLDVGRQLIGVHRNETAAFSGSRRRQTRLCGCGSTSSANFAPTGNRRCG